MQPLKVLIVGCGGVGSYLVPPLAKTLNYAAPGSTLILVDGDTITLENLDRQLFQEKDIGKFKTEALARNLRQHSKLKVECISKYASPLLELPAVNMSIVAVDNHVARNFALSYSDMNNSPMISGANEDKAAESFIYVPSLGWKDNDNLDPRKLFPNITTDLSDDPNHPEGCTGATALTTAPQTAEANFVAAALCLRMFGAWVLNTVAPEFIDYLPARFESNFSSITTVTVGQLRNSK